MSLLVFTLVISTASSFAQNATKPNILVIFGRDIGITNISAYSDGLLGYETPNIDRIVKVSGSCNTTETRAAPLAVERSLPVSISYGPVSRRLASREPTWASSPAM